MNLLLSLITTWRFRGDYIPFFKVLNHQSKSCNSHRRILQPNATGIELLQSRTLVVLIYDYALVSHEIVTKLFRRRYMRVFKILAISSPIIGKHDNTDAGVWRSIL